jgi:hypothetical protein
VLYAAKPLPSVFRYSPCIFSTQQICCLGLDNAWKIAAFSCQTFNEFIIVVHRSLRKM